MSDNLHPESEMMGFAFDPDSVMGSIKPPIFQTSTFAFKTAEEGKAFFEKSRQPLSERTGEKPSYIYSRIGSPNLDIFEKRLALWDRAEASATFESGMGAITAVLLEFLKPGDLVVHTTPLYGGTDWFVKNEAPKWGITSLAIEPNMDFEAITRTVEKTGLRPALFYIETPANPTNDLFSFKLFKKLADHYSSPEKRVFTCADNTFLGPIWQKPLDHGIDLIMYSATKYIGGHSDLIAGAVSGSFELISRVKAMRSMLGNMAGPHTAWLLARSLETLKLRMDQHEKNAQKVAEFLRDHPKVKSIKYLGLMAEDSHDREILKSQCLGSGAMISFEIEGGESEAYAFLNQLKMIKLAVSLGSTESLAQHPRTMTHSAADPEYLDSMGISPSMIRLSVGIENAEDIIADLQQALEEIELSKI